MSKSVSVHQVGVSGTTANTATPSRLVLSKIGEITKPNGTIERTYKILGAAGTIPAVVLVTDSSSSKTLRMTTKFTFGVVQTESLTGAEVVDSMDISVFFRVPLGLGITGVHLRDAVAQVFAQMAFGALVSNAFSDVKYLSLLNGATDVAG